jgi:hypothetical protein
MVEELPETKKEFASSSPPGYFDIVPDSYAFFPPKLPSSGPKHSTATAREKFKGVYSHDPILDRNPNELWRFLVSNLRQPRLAVHVSGTHTETRSTGQGGIATGQGGIANGGTTTTHTVTDFSFYVDVSKYVIPQWIRIVARPKSKKDQPTPTLRETLEEYTSSTNPFKELRLEKQLLWDIERITQLLTDLVRSTGYGVKRRQKITVKFPMQDYKVVALASNQYSQAAHSKVVRVLCVLSCLCVVFWPAWAIARKRMKNRLACEYCMAVSADELYARNCAWIHSSVVGRRESKEWIVAL